MTPVLKAPGTRHLKPKYDEPPSNFAFKINLRRHSKDPAAGAVLLDGVDLRDLAGGSLRTSTRPTLNPTPPPTPLAPVCMSIQHEGVML